MLLRRLAPQADRRAARQTLWMGAITAAQVVGGVAHAALSARILGPEGFGVLVVVIAAASLVFGLATIPGEEVITTYVTRSAARGRPDEAGQAARLALGAALGMRAGAYGLIAGAALLAAGPLGVVDAVYARAMLLYGVCGVLTSMTGECLALLRLADRLPLGFAAAGAGALAGVGALLWAWLSGGGLLAVVMASVVKTAVLGGGLGLAAAAMARRAGVPGLLRSLSVTVPRDIRRFHLASFGRSSVEALHLHADALLLAGLTSASQVGLYRAARYVTDAAKLPFLAAAQGVQVEYSRHWYAGGGEAGDGAAGGGRAEVRRLARRAAALTAAAAAAGYAALFVFHQQIIAVVLGPDFAAAGRSLQIMIPGAFVVASITVLSVIPTATGRAVPQLAAMSAAVAAQAVALAVLAPRLGAAGAAWGFTVHALVFAAVILPCAAAILRGASRRRTPRPAPRP